VVAGRDAHRVRPPSLLRHSPQDGVYIVGASGGGLRRLSSTRAAAVDWSPDGRKLAVVEYPTGALSLLDPDTATPSRSMSRGCRRAA
jgi:Tol biopolymer transport system component